MSSALIESVKAVVPSLLLTDRLVIAHFFAPDHSSSASQLQTILGLAKVVQVNGAIGRFGRRVQESPGSHPDGLANGEYEQWHVIATGRATKNVGFVWQLREEGIAGLLACGFAELVERLPYETVGTECLVEGAVRQITANAYNQSPVT